MATKDDVSSKAYSLTHTLTHTNARTRARAHTHTETKGVSSVAAAPRMATTDDA